MTKESDHDPSSPACSMHSADDVYMGYVSKTELVDQLNALLAAERAGARMAMKSRRNSSAPGVVDFFRTLTRDEASCCAMLARHIQNLGGPVTSEVGAFYQSAMAIADINTRLAFLNRGQGWVVRRLERLLPRVRDDALHADLRRMLETHVSNIDAATGLIKPISDQPSS